jgi:opacity protein-like surface antigen
MRMIVLAAALVSAASPALCANSPYVEVGAGIADARSNKLDALVEYSTVEFRPQATVPPPQDTLVRQVFATRSKGGYDVNLASGFDFGWLRLEGEVAQRKVRTNVSAESLSAREFLSQLNTNLNRPSVAPDPGAPGLPALSDADFRREGHFRATSAMFNAILDVKFFRRVTGFAGTGVGRTWVSALGDHDSGGAFQYFLGMRFLVGDRLELGIKHRYFSSGNLKLVYAPLSFPGNPSSHVGPELRNRLTNSMITENLEGKWRSRSLDLTVGYKF